MALSTDERRGRPIEFSAGELTGALGDSVTVLPIVVAIGALTPASLAHVLVWFGLFQIVWGTVYGLPISVEPMKALAGLAVAGAIGYGELVAAGLLAGATLLIAGRGGLLSRVERFVGEPVVRGVQLAVALLLAETGLGLALGDPIAAVAAAALVGAVAALGHPRASALVVLGAGGVAAVAESLRLPPGGGPTLTGAAASVPGPSLPAPGVFPAGGPALTGAAVEGAAAQLAMTVGNAAVATALLCSDLFDAEVSPDELASSMGVMSLLAVPLGGLPMCHGSGGLAGKYAFGARTGGANVVLGALYLGAALFAGVVAAFPTAVLGVLLALVALQLGASAAETDRPLLTAAVGLTGLFANVGVAFALGAAAWIALDRR